MSEIARTGKWNPGGGRWLEVIAIDDVASYTRAGTAAPVIALLAGKSWTRVYTTPGTLQYSQEPKRTDNGLLYTHEMKGFSPDDKAQKAAALMALLLAERVLVRFCDNSGLIRQIGSPVEYVSFDYTFTTDPDVPGSRGYSLVLTATTTTPAAYV